jgi:anion-transporting  ArsA/GET3 family ATPase
MGPVRNQADSVMNLLRSRQTAVHLVTLLEEMPVQETADGVTELAAIGLPVGAVLVNMVRDPMLPAETLEAAAAGGLDVDELSRGLKAAGLDSSPAQVVALAAEAADHAGRVLLEQRERAVLAQLERPTVELPLLDDADELSGVLELARRLSEAGLR